MKYEGFAIWVFTTYCIYLHNIRPDQTLTGAFLKDMGYVVGVRV